jgi:acyl-CoA synthetase (AMP-forming)/AMP-acid ligase II
MRVLDSIYFFALLVLSVVLFSFRAEAVNEEWKYVASNEQGDRIFYDSSSVIPLSENAVQVWVKNLGHDGSSMKILEEINCSYKIVRERQIISERRGKSLLPPRPRTSWKAMELDPVMKKMHKVLCK